MTVGGQEGRGTLDFEGRQVPVHAGDTVASALFRSGVRVFSRSFKYHRRRGLYCLTGDCANCLVSIDHGASVRACVTDAAAGQRVRREAGWPSTDRDVLGILDRLHWLLPVGFYYKAMVRPRWLWPLVEPWVRRLAGQGEIPEGTVPADREVRHVHPDILVVGGGVAGLAAALTAAEAGERVLLCDEGKLGELIAPGPSRRRIDELVADARAADGIKILERTAAVGIYEGPLVVLNEASLLHLVHPRRIIVATGAIEEHGVFPGNDLPGVWLGRGAARMAGVYDMAPGCRVVLVGRGTEAEQHAATLRAAGAHVTQLDGRIEAAHGRHAVTSVVVGGARYPCDALVLSLGLAARDGLARQAAGLPVVVAGDAALPGCSVEEAEASGRQCVLGEAISPAEAVLPAPPHHGVLCLCEDVGVDELQHAWDEGFRSAEILKRYTTTTMGPCQGAMCHRHLRSFVAARDGATGSKDGPTTARPPTRRITLEQAAAGVRDHVHQRTALHQRHVELGASMELAGLWQRPQRYGDMLDEYWAVRRAVSAMDVGTLGKFLVAGPDALEFLERLYPCRVGDLEPGLFRYTLLLAENGFVVDDGIVCALGGGRWYVTFTSSGATTAEATLRDWAETWGLEVHLVDLTAAWGAINVAGPRSRELLQRLSSGPLDNESFPYRHHRELTVAGVPCRAIRLGFVGELSYELHHPSSLSVTLWDALLEAGADLGIRPHGLDALQLLRLEKGHVIVGQDTDFDSTPSKLNMAWAVKLDKPTFVGKKGVERANAHEPIRKLVALSFEGQTPPEGAPLRVGGRYVGNLSSSHYSPVLERGVGIGWVDRVGDSFPDRVQTDGAIGSVVQHAFYDPEGARLRG